MKKTSSRLMIIFLVVLMLVSTPFSSFAGCTVYKHAEEGGFEPATVAGASYYPLDDALIYDAGPGKFITDLVINEGSENAKEENLLKVGEASVWNTREEICATVEMIDGWQLEDVFIYLGYEGMPVSNSGTPQIGQFPFVENFSKPVSSYELNVDLEDYFEFTWGKWDRENRVWQISIYANVVMETDAESGKSKIHEEASALGMNGNETKWGWYSNYLVEHPETGHFVDAPVGGVNFDTSSHKGKTDANGAFDYIAGENVTLSIGDLELGVVPACHKITPLDLLGAESTSDVGSINMARILQSLDRDQDPKRGIDIPEEAVESLNETMEEMGITSVDFDDSLTVDELINKTVVKANNEKNLDLIVVSMDAAKDNLTKGILSNVFRKNISKTPEMLTTKAKLEFMPVYVPARKANGDLAQISYYQDDLETEDIIEEVYIETKFETTPLVVTYTDEVEGTGASDVFSAVSRDDGSTWKVTNISRSAGRSSFTLEDGTEYPGDVDKPQCKVRGNYILIAWTSKFARSGKPRYSIKTNDEYCNDDEYYVEDIYGVGGPQRSVDYADEGFSEVGEIPYSAVWTCRGVVVTESMIANKPDQYGDNLAGDIIWFKPERLTSGRRDACQLMFNGNPNVGYALTWQEDPDGLRPGKEAGPGEGWSGATTNHKTDIWYSYISWGDFGKEDIYFESGGNSNHEEEIDWESGRAKVMVPFSLPVRLSDNDVVNSKNMKWDEVKEQSDSEITDEETIDYMGTHMYGYLVPGLMFPETGSAEDDGSRKSFDIDLETGYFNIEEVRSYLNDSGIETDEKYFFDKTSRGSGDENHVLYTTDERLLDGDTGASRPNIMMQPYTKPDGTKSAWVVVVYEETKGLGSGPPDVAGISSDSDSIYEESESGTGTGAGTNKYFPDLGKNVIYHSFDLYNPDEVSAGNILNPQERVVDEETGYYTDELVYLVDEAGVKIVDDFKEELHPEDDNYIPAYENARRPRLIIQSKGAMGDSKTTMVCVFKMGEDGQGRPSDIMLTRFVAPETGNPYAFKNIEGWEAETNANIVYQNISSTSVLGWELTVGESSSGKRDESIKVTKWDQTVDNLNDSTSSNPNEDARAHRGIIRGDFIAIAYTHTPNWYAARNGNDRYDLYIRRSFDGGQTWTTEPASDDWNGTSITYDTIYTRYDPQTRGNFTVEDQLLEERTYQAGEFEPARNVSLLKNNKMSIIEPRLVGTPGTIKVDGVWTGELEDKQNINAYWVTYGTESYPGRNSDEVGEPLDLFYSHTEDTGQNYFVVEHTVNPDSQGNHAGETSFIWDWLAKDTGKNEAAQAECQIRMKPDGETFYSVWNETGLDGSDVKFRKLNINGIYGISEDRLTEDITPPVIMISGVSDGDVTSENVAIDIKLSEMGTFTGKLYKDDELVGTLTSDNVPYEVVATAQADVYRLEVNAEDTSGNKSAKNIAFTVDNRIPTITISGVLDGETTTENRTVTFSGTGDITSATLLKNSLSQGEGAFESGTLLAEDAHYEVLVESTNTISSLTSVKSVEWVIDTENPEVNISSVVEGETYYKKATPNIVISDNHSTTDEMTIVISLMKDGVEVGDYISGATISEVGSYELFASAVDLAGNSASDEVSFKVEEAVTPTQDDDNDSNDNSNKKDKKDEPVVIEESSVDGYSANGAMKIYVPLAVSENDPEITILTSESVLDIPDNSVMINDEIYEITLKDADGNLIEEFDEPITFTYLLDDFTAGNMKEIKDLKINYWDEDLQVWVAMPTEFDEATKTLTAQADHLSRFSVLSLPDFPEFEDIKGKKIENLIYKMASLGIVNGDENGDFRADDIIKREEFIKLLMAASNEQPDEECNLRYSDSNNVSHWAKGYISKATEKGILVGYEDNTIRSKDETTHGECASIISKLYRRNGINLQYNRPSSAGVDYGWASKYFNDLMANGIIDEPVDSCCKLTRAEAADIIMKYMLNTH